MHPSITPEHTSPETPATPVETSRHDATEPRARTSRRQLTLGLLGGAGLIWLCAHFLATALHLMPLTLVGVHYRGLTESYIQPYFSQRWSLFAPEPPTMNAWVEYQCEDEAAGQTGWLRVGASLRETHRRRRFTPASYLRRVEGSGVMAILGEKSEQFDKLIASVDVDDPDALEQFSRVFHARQLDAAKRARRVYRLAHVRCQDAVTSPRSVRVRAVWRDIPKYSFRNDPPSEAPPKAKTLPWRSVDAIDRLPAEVAEQPIPLDALRALVLEARSARASDPAPAPAQSDRASESPIAAKQPERR